MRLIRGGWPQEKLPGWLSEMFADDAPWHVWTPEVLRRVAGSAHCAIPPIPGRDSSHSEEISEWGPLLQLFHFHLGWPRVDLGLARWASAGFPTIDDPTLTTIKELWDPGLAPFVGWYLTTYGEPHLLSPHLKGVLLNAAVQPLSWATTGGSDPLHLGAHYGGPTGGHANPYASLELRAPEWCEVRHVGPGHDHLVVPGYAGWYAALTTYGNQQPAMVNGRSWRIDMTIAPIGHIGRFRRSKVSGRWFTGRHKAHALGVV